MVLIVHHPEFDASSVPDGHRFPMRKYGLLADRLRQSGRFPESLWRTPSPALREDLERAHDPRYVDAVLSGTLDTRAQRRIGFPVTPDVVRRSLLSCGATLLAGELALATGAAASTAGGSHHASRDGGAGFCVFNDVAVAALALLVAGRASSILIVDADVHHGDGTAIIFGTTPNVFTLSVHCADNWPTRKPPSDLDVALPKGTSDETYLQHFSNAIQTAVQRASPDLIFYNAGVDPHEEDRLGLLSLTDDGLRRRDAALASLAREHQIPVCGVLGGGYGASPDAVARRHTFLFDAFADAFGASVCSDR
ncbi:histone deacetylase [bacterium]|nr:histone deacetylase [bacterium]